MFDTETAWMRRACHGKGAPRATWNLKSMDQARRPGMAECHTVSNFGNQGDPTRQAHY